MHHEQKKPIPKYPVRLSKGIPLDALAKAVAAMQIQQAEAEYAAEMAKLNAKKRVALSFPRHSRGALIARIGYVHVAFLSTLSERAPKVHSLFCAN